MIEASCKNQGRTTTRGFWWPERKSNRAPAFSRQERLSRVTTSRTLNLDMCSVRIGGK